MTPLEIARHYFELSNDSNFAEISKLFHDGSTVRSGKGELFLGVENIMAMQRAHHGNFARLEWSVKSVTEVKPGIIHFVFDFNGETQSGEQVEYSGLEDVIVFAGKIQHIQVELL